MHFNRCGFQIFHEISASTSVDWFVPRDGTTLSSSQTLLSSLVNFINRYFSPNVEVVEDQLIAGTGCSSLLEALAPLLCDPGEIILGPAPFWPVARLVLGKSQVVLSAVVPPTESVENILDWNDQLQNHWQDHISGLVASGKKPRAILLSNPQNPMGRSYSKEYLVGILSLCQKVSVRRYWLFNYDRYSNLVVMSAE